MLGCSPGCHRSRPTRPRTAADARGAERPRPRAAGRAGRISANRTIKKKRKKETLKEQKKRKKKTTSGTDPLRPPEPRPSRRSGGRHRSGSLSLTQEAVLGPHPEGWKPLDLERPTPQPGCRAPTSSGAVAPLAPPPTRLERPNGLASLCCVVHPHSSPHCRPPLLSAPLTPRSFPLASSTEPLPGLSSWSWPHRAPGAPCPQVVPRLAS